MPADRNLILFSNATLSTTSTSPAVDIGMGGTPVDHPLVARTFYSGVAASITLALTIQASYDNTNFRDIVTGQMGIGPNAEPQERALPFYTRRRYVRGMLAGGAVSGVTVDINAFARNSPEMYMD